MGRHDEGFFTAKDNSRLFWVYDLPEESVQPRAHVALVHGYGDHCGRYQKTIQALVKAGFAVHAVDYRGHGHADGRRGHCDAFGDFVDDVELFWNRVVERAGDKKAFLLGHSFGGLISLHLAARQPRKLAGLILSAPMLVVAVKTPTLKVLGAKIAGSIIPWLPIDLGLKPEMLTRESEEQKLVANDPLYNKVGTPRWYNEATVAQAKAIEMGPSIKVPTFVFCGDSDPIISTPATREFFKTIASADKQLKEYPGMLHECLNEIGREQVWSDVTSWISSHL